MMITKKAMSRRTVLRGIGTTLALPLLDGMVPALSALSATAAKPVVRFGAVYVPNGIVMQNWTPALEGSAFEITPILEPLAPFRDQMLVLSGLNSTPPGGVRGGVHSRAATRFLTDEQPRQLGPWVKREPVSMDQIAARELGKHTPLASLELGLEGANFAGSCDSGGFSCAFSYTISWRNASTPLPMEHNPRAIFERLFGDSQNTDPAAQRARMLDQRSILDSVSEEVARLRRRLGPTDRVKVGAYLEAVRDVERRIQMAEAQGVQEVPLVDRPLGVPTDFVDHVTLMYDLQLLAYQIDRTRVVTFMAGHELSGRTYPEIGVPDAHHPLSHHRGVPASLAKLTKLNTHHVSLFASFLEKLRSTPDGRRRVVAGSRHDRVWRRHERQQRAFALQPADAVAGWRGRPARERPPYRVSRGYAAGEPACLVARQAGYANREDRRQQRAAAESVFGARRAVVGCVEESR